MYKTMILSVVLWVWNWASRGWEFFSSPPRSDRLWGPSRLLPNG